MNQSFIGKIIAVAGPLKGQDFTLGNQETTIGRETDNDIVIPQDRNVSRHHCRIFEHNKAIWIEDLGSSNGTLITHPGLSPLRLTPREPAIVFENSLIQLGSNQFEISGLSDYQHEALGTVGFQFQEIMADMCNLLPQLSSEQKEDYRAALQELEEHIRLAKSEQELLSFITRGIQKLSAAFLNANDLNQTVFFDPSLALPPLPDDLPELEGEGWIDSIRNIFITDIKRCLPPDEDKETP
jgi:hypothetical protein